MKKKRGRPKTFKGGKPVSIYADAALEKAVQELEKEWGCGKSAVVRRAVHQAVAAERK